MKRAREDGALLLLIKKPASEQAGRGVSAGMEGGSRMS